MSDARPTVMLAVRALESGLSHDATRLPIVAAPRL